MPEIARILAALDSATGKPAALATLVKVEGSSYRRPGARLLLLPDDTRLGSISGGCLHCQWQGKDARQLDTAGTCAGGPVFGPAVGVLGVMQAAEAIKLLLGRAGDSPRQSRLVNLLEGSQLTIAREARPDCPVCSRLDQLKTAQPVAASDTSLFLDATGVAKLGASVQTLYLTEPGEAAPGGVTSASPLDLARLRELAAGPLVLTCRYGVRSAALARLLRAEGHAHVFALTQT